MNTMRTALLMAAMTALLGVCGYLIGGRDAVRAGLCRDQQHDRLLER